MKSKHEIFMGLATNLVAGTLALGGCASSTSTSSDGTTTTETETVGTETAPQNLGDAQKMLNQAKVKWERAGLRSYTYQFERSCFCPEEWRKATTVTVLGDSVARARYVEPDEQVPAENIERYQTIGGLFAKLQEAIDRRAYQMDVTYDPTYGYPTSAVIDYDQRMADEEMRFNASELKPIR